jgi:hypothetical protein
MAVYIELTTDAFAQVFNQQQSAVTPQGRAGISNARRPLRGLEIKDDTYAIFKIITSNGTALPLIDSGAVGGTNTQDSNFILQSVTEARMEKHQIVETFGESYIFFFGESPRFLDVQAILIDSFDFNWYAEFWQNYDLYLRGSKSVEMGARTYLFYDDNIVEGYMLMAQATKVADQPLQARLTFRLFLTNYQNISFIGSDVYPIRAGVAIPPDAMQTAANAYQPPDSQGLGSNVTDGTLQSSLQIQAGIGASLSVGFGGTSLLTAALTAGVQPTGNVSLYETEQSASFRTTGSSYVIPPALLGLSQDQAYAAIAAGVEASLEPDITPLPEIPRTLPLRSLISDNTDEYTGMTPQAPGADDPSTSEAPDLSQTARQHGARGELWGWRWGGHRHRHGGRRVRRRELRRDCRRWLEQRLRRHQRRPGIHRRLRHRRIRQPHHPAQPTGFNAARRDRHPQRHAGVRQWCADIRRRHRRYRYWRRHPRRHHHG